MTKLTLNYYRETGKIVTESHFGGNAIYSRNTENGDPDPEFMRAVDLLDISTLRYPAGQPEIAYAEGLIVNNELPTHVVSFLNAARAHGHEVVLVTPIASAYSGPAELRQFVELVLEEYGDVVHAFEVGNEYWGLMGEDEYSKIANDSVLAIDQGMAEAGEDIPIWIQMANAGGKHSDFLSSEAGWIDRTVLANQEIISGISGEALGKIDGVVEHYYFRNNSQYIGEILDSEQLISLDYSIWKSALGDDITLNITEWNVRSTNLYQLGMRAATSLVAQFSYMVELGVAEAHVWPPMHNMTSDLAGAENVIVSGDHNTVTNTVSGSAFDLMSSNLVGLELVSAGFENSTELVQTNVYSNDEVIVVYVGSRANSVQSVDVGLGSLFPDAYLLGATKLGYDQNTADGKHWDVVSDTFVPSDFVVIDEEPYFLNEHDANATVTHLDIGSSIENTFNMTLAPYEMVQLTYNRGTTANDVGDEIIGSANTDRLFGTESSEYCNLLSGNDNFTAKGGNDTVYGGGGDDYLNTGSGNDIGYGGSGSDMLRGWGGNDQLLGGRGDDDIDGGDGKDILKGGEGKDLLLGAFGDDRLFGGSQRDRLAGGAGDDVLKGGAYGDKLFGGSGADILFGHNGLDTLNGGSGADILDGGNRNDIIIGGGGADTMRGGQGSDAFVFSKGHGHDTVSDFNVFDDTLEISNRLSDGLSVENIYSLAKVVAGGVELNFGEGDSLLLVGLTNTVGLANAIDIV